MLCWVFISPIDFFVCFYNRFVLYLKILLKGWCIGRETGSTTNLFTITYTKCSWLHYGGESILFIGSHRNPYSKGRIVWCKILLHVFSTIVSNISNLIRSTIILLTLYAPHWFFFLLISLIGIYKIIKSMPFFSGCWCSASRAINCTQEWDPSQACKGKVILSFYWHIVTSQVLWMGL